VSFVPPKIRRQLPDDLQHFPISAYMSQETWLEAHKLARLEHKKYAGFGHFVGELMREAVEEYRREREARETGGVREDLSE
jgi:predicted translin family RNA/ssDNA-binding protein